MDLNQFLLDLYRLALGTPTAEFSGAVLERLKTEVAFETAIWGSFTGTPAGPRPHWGHLHNLPPEMLTEYERVKQHDILSSALIARPGRSVAISLAQAARKRAHPDVIAHARKWGMEQTLATARLESPLNLFTLVSIYRRDRRRPFALRERRFKEAAMPHLVAAWHMNAIHFLDAPDGPVRGERRARALVDELGVILNADAGLGELFGREVAKWTGPVVPPEIMAALDGPDQRYEGRAIVVTRPRAFADRTAVLAVRLRAPGDTLTERERQVARAFASGKTYKQVAALFGTSPATVRSQLQAAYAKLGVSSKVDLGKILDESR